MTHAIIILYFTHLSKHWEIWKHKKNHCCQLMSIFGLFCKVKLLKWRGLSRLLMLVTRYVAALCYHSHSAWCMAMLNRLSFPHVVLINNKRPRRWGGDVQGGWLKLAPLLLPPFHNTFLLLFSVGENYMAFPLSLPHPHTLPCLSFVFFLIHPAAFARTTASLLA